MENLCKEFWKPAFGFESYYEISNYGRLKSLNYHRTNEEKILKPHYDTKGYTQGILCINGKPKRILIHRLMWETFIGAIPFNMQINHIDENKANNFLWVNDDGSVDLEKSNLNLMTNKENINWGTRNGRASKLLTNGKKSKKVLQFDLNGTFIKEYPSTREIQRQTGYAQTNISSVCLGKYKQAYGYIWKYE